MEKMIVVLCLSLTAIFFMSPSRPWRLTQTPPIPKHERFRIEKFERQIKRLLELAPQSSKIVVVREKVKFLED